MVWGTMVWGTMDPTRYVPYTGTVELKDIARVLVARQLEFTKSTISCSASRAKFCKGHAFLQLHYDLGAWRPGKRSDQRQNKTCPEQTITTRPAQSRHEKAKQRQYQIKDKPGQRRQDMTHPQHDKTLANKPMPKPKPKPNPNPGGRVHT